MLDFVEVQHEKSFESALYSQNLKHLIQRETDEKFGKNVSASKMKISLMISSHFLWSMILDIARITKLQKQNENY